MKNNTTPRRNSFSFSTMLIGAALVSGFYVYHQNERQYSSGIKTVKEKEQTNGALGMMQYFLNARKNPLTGKMDYKAMSAANAEATQIMQAASSRTARVTAGLNMTWTSMGPSNIGGRTRAILVDNQYPNGSHLFACAVSGGIWRSTDGGQIWDSVPGNDKLPSLNASCIAQDASGNLYVGTGEGFSLYSQGDGFSTGMIGGGMLKSTDDGNTWTSMPSTVPPANSDNNPWSYINRIAIDPNNASNIYAGTYGGLMYSSDGGNTWNKMLNTVGNTALGGNCLDVKMSKDGQLMLAFAGGKLWYANVSGLVTHMTQVPATLHHGGVYGSNTARIEISISPSNSNYAYVSVIVSGAGGLGVFGQGAPAGTGIYMTMTAKAGASQYWYLIGPGGSNSFNPYSSGGSQDQPCYDNAMAVDPNTPGNLLIAGTVVWKWTQIGVSDTVGAWTDLTYYGGFPHPDMHAITFSPGSSTVLYDGNDGGIYQSTNGGTSWQPINRNYDVTQFDAISFAPFMSASVAGMPPEGVMGGTQDNGTPYINGLQTYYEDAVDVGGGDGGRSYISQIDPNIYFVTSDNNSLFRGGSLATLGAIANLYSNTVGDTLGCNLDSLVRAWGGGGCFYHQFAVYENSYDTTENLDVMKWIADSNYPAGHTVHPVSPNGNVPFPYKLKSAVVAGDTLIIQNAVVSKLAAGFNASNGVWLMMQAADLTDPAVWMPIGGPNSKPDAFSGADASHALAWSPDGDALFVGTEGGQLYRFSNLDSIQDTRYTTGALYSIKRGGGVVVNANCRVISKKISANMGGDILSISVDPKNGNNVLVTIGNYTGGAHVYFSSNALSAAPTFASAQGTGLPSMPTYSSVLDVLNSGQANSALVGTERGIYSTTNINAGSPTWTVMPGTSGIPNTLIADMKQQTLPPWNANNSYNVYVGTHGRGAWVSSTFFKPLGVQPVVADATAEEGLKVYPNPMTYKGTVEFYLPNESGNVTITVYDIIGKAVKTIVLENQAKGQHLVNINAEELGTGTYIACVTGDGFRKSARFVVVK